MKGSAQISIEAGTTYLDEGATWTDAVDGNGTLLAQGEVKNLVPGLYVLRYDSKTDAAGNQSETVTRTNRKRYDTTDDYSEWCGGSNHRSRLPTLRMLVPVGRIS